MISGFQSHNSQNYNLCRCYSVNSIPRCNLSTHLTHLPSGFGLGTCKCRAPSSKGLCDIFRLPWREAAQKCHFSITILLTTSNLGFYLPQSHIIFCIFLKYEGPISIRFVTLKHNKHHFKIGHSCLGCKACMFYLALFHILQPLPIRCTQQDLCCSSKSSMKNDKKLDLK